MRVQLGFHQSHADTVALRPIKLVPVLNHLHSLEMEGGAKWVTVSPQVRLPSAGVQGFCNNRAPRLFLPAGAIQPGKAVHIPPAPPSGETYTFA